MARNFENLIEDGFLQVGKHLPNPVIWRRWAAISAIAGAMGKRSWFEMGDFIIPPNLFIILVGGPGSGKSMSLNLPFDKVFEELAEGANTRPDDFKNKFKKYGEKVPLWRISDKITAPQLAVDLAKCRVPIKSLCTFENGMVYESSATMTTSELGSFMTRNDQKVQAFMTEMWDARNRYSDRIKTGDAKFLIKEPCLNWIACATPEQLVAQLPENADEQGLLSRLILVYNDSDRVKLGYKVNPIPQTEIEHLAYDLKEIKSIQGTYKFENEEVEDYADYWATNSKRPTHPIMETYNNRRPAHVIKVAMVMAAAKRNETRITRQDFDEAVERVTEVEELMPLVLDRFGMSNVGLNINSLLAELKGFVKDKRRGMRESKFRHLVLSRCKTPAEAQSYIDNLQSSDLIKISKGIVTPK